MPDPFLDADAIRSATFIRHVEIHDTLGSTNDRAAQLARIREIELPALIAARVQTAGRGRGKNVWWSAEGALTFSVLLDPVAFGISTANWPQLSLATAVAVCDALSIELQDMTGRAGASPPPCVRASLGAGDGPARANPQSAIRIPQSPRLAIKWPNDVMIDGGKICGILIESPGGAAPAKNRVIIGIGINVNNSLHRQSPACGLAQPHEKVPNATTLREVTTGPHDIQQLLINTLRALETRSRQLASLDPQLPITWQQHCWLRNQSVEVRSNGDLLTGVCIGIDGDGALVVENAVTTKRIHSGSVRVV